MRIVAAVESSVAEWLFVASEIVFVRLETFRFALIVEMRPIVEMWFVVGERFIAEFFELFEFRFIAETAFAALLVRRFFVAVVLPFVSWFAFEMFVAVFAVVVVVPRAECPSFFFVAVVCPIFALGYEVVAFAAEKFVFLELAFECAVHYLYFLRRV